MAKENRDKQVISVFVKNFHIEYVLISSVISALILNLGSGGEVGFLPALLFFGLMSVIICILHWIYYGRKHLVQLTSGREVLFAGEMNQLIKTLIAHKITLGEKIGEYYIFTTNYWLFPKARIVVQERNGQCLLQGEWIIIKYLSEVIELEDYKLADNKERKDVYTSVGEFREHKA